jgi:hypothetical protein
MANETIEEQAKLATAELAFRRILCEMEVSRRGVGFDRGQYTLPG